MSGGWEWEEEIGCYMSENTKHPIRRMNKCKDLAYMSTMLGISIK